MDLEVLVDDASDGSQLRYRFGRSPIRLGRSPLNDLPLPWAFVSHCHAVVQFDGTAITYVDLGSTNGTHVGGARVPHNTPIAITAGSEIRICALTLRVRPAESSAPARMTYSNLGDQPLGSADVARTHTNALARDASVAHVAAAYDAYRAAFDSLFSTVVAASEGSVGRDREAYVAAILERCPTLPQEAAFRRWLGTDATVTSGSDDVAVDLARRLGLPREEGGPGLAERLASLLLRFANAFVELRRGHEEFVSNLGLGLIGEKSPLTTERDGRAVLAYLLDVTGDAARLDELNRAYADLMLHQMAMVGASTAGAREVVAALAPNMLVPRETGIFAGLFRASRKLRALERRLEDLAEERALTSLLFGRSFARAYSVLLGRGSAV